MRARAVALGLVVPSVASCVLGVLATFAPPVFVGPNGNEQIAPYGFLNTLSFNAAVVAGLVGGAVVVNLWSRFDTFWLLIGETAAVAAVGWLVAELAGRLVAGLPAPCSQLRWSGLWLALNPFWVGPTVASILLATRFGKTGAPTGRVAMFVVAVLLGLFGAVTLFSTIDNGIVELLFYHC